MFSELRPGLEFSEGARMARGYTGAVPYDPTIYLGSAAHYRYGRPAYSPELEALLTQKTGLDGTGRLLDAGCWTPAAVLAYLPYVSPIYLSGRSAWTLTPACLRRAAVPPRRRGSRTSGGSRAWPRTCPPSRQDRTSW